MQNKKKKAANGEANGKEVKPVRLLFFNQTKQGKDFMARTNTLLKEVDDIPKVVSTKKIRMEHLKKIKPLTLTQEKVFNQYHEGYNLVLHGMAGVGKSFLAIYLALEEILSKESPYRKLAVVRSVVPVRDIGFLPGSIEEKVDVYQQPYKAIFKELFPGVDQPAQKLYEQDIYNFIPTSFIRGVTLHDTIIVVDEAENLNFHEADSIITRLGNNCKIVFCGDLAQTDLTKKEDRDGFKNFMKILDNIPEFRHIEFYEDDIVRSNLVKQYIIAKHKLGM